jgi:hypothetical protein
MDKRIIPHEGTVTIQVDNKPVSERERAKERGELTREFINAKLLKDGYTALKDFEKEELFGSATPPTEEVLQYARDLKMVELDQKCSQAIVGRFTAMVDGVEYSFSCDEEAQKNFDKADWAFSKGNVPELPWTAYNSEGQVVRILINPDNFGPVYLAHLEHIQNNIAKFRDFLQPMVEGAEDPDEVFSVKWGEG